MKRKLVAPLLIAVTTVLGFSLTQITKNNIIFAQSLNSEQTNEPCFQPGVKEFLRTLPGNRGVSATPDPNETLEVIQTYRKLRNSPQEIEGFRTLVQRYPDSRLAHQGLGSAYRNRFQSTNDREFARLALEQYVKAAEIGLSFGRVLYNGGIRELSLNSGYPELAQQWFEQALTQYPDDFTLNLEYARLLAALNNNQAEQFFLKAIENRTAGKISPHVYYTEFLIDKQQYKKALEYSLLPDERSFYLDFLRGYVLEKLRRGEEATSFYEKYMPMNRHLPAPNRFRIEGSPYQRNIQFQEEISKFNSPSSITLSNKSGSFVKTMLKRLSKSPKLS